MSPFASSVAGPTTKEAGAKRLSEELKAKIHLAEPWVAEVTHRFWDHPRLAGLFPAFMISLYWSSHGSVELIRAAERVARERADADPICRRLATYFQKHYADEKAHPGWLARDMRAIGIDVESELSRIPPASNAALLGAQHYWVEQVHPVACLGHFAVLEGSPPSEPHLREVQKRTGLPGEAFRMMIAHAHLDPSHSAEIDELLDELPLDPRLRSLVGLSALHTLEKVTAIYQELLEQA